MMDLSLAQSSSPTDAIFQWALIAAGVSVVLILLGIVTYKRLLRLEPDTDAKMGFTLGDLRQMHREGKITDEEFAKAKALLITQTRAAAASPAKEKHATAGATPAAGEDAAVDVDLQDVSDSDDVNLESPPNAPSDNTDAGDDNSDDAPQTPPGSSK